MIIQVERHLGNTFRLSQANFTDIQNADIQDRKLSRQCEFINNAPVEFGLAFFGIPMGVREFIHGAFFVVHGRFDLHIKTFISWQVFDIPDNNTNLKLFRNLLSQLQYRIELFLYLSEYFLPHAECTLTRDCVWFDQVSPFNGNFFIFLIDDLGVGRMKKPVLNVNIRLSDKEIHAIESLVHAY